MRESIPITEGSDTVSRRELNSEILHLLDLLKKDEELFKKDIELINEKFAARDKELIMQATEYHRRLKELNGETGRVQNILERSIPREVFDNYVRESNGITQGLKEYFNQRADSNKASFDKRIKEISDWITKQEGSMRVIIWFVGIAVTILIGMIIFSITGKR